MEADDNIHIVRFTYTGEEEIPDEATHIFIAVRVVPARAFADHPNIVEVICGEDVEKIEEGVFSGCPSLRLVIMPGVKEVEMLAFASCVSLTNIECGKLGIIGEWAFHNCTSLSSVDLPSIKIIGGSAFCICWNLTNAKFGKDLESIGAGAFYLCGSLQRITLPLKDGMITHDGIFSGCKQLNHVDLVEGAVLSETIAALLLKDWKNNMNANIDAINRILGTTPAGAALSDAGGKAREIREWIRSVLGKIVCYKAQHCRYVDVAAATLQSSLPNDIVIRNILPFLELPPYAFEGEDFYLLENEDDPSPAPTLEPALRQDQDSVVNVEIEEQVNHYFFGSPVALSLVIVVVSILMGLSLIWLEAKASTEQNEL